MHIHFIFVVFTVFSVRQHIAYMLSALYAIARPSVCHTGGSVKNSYEIFIIW